jgi:hypothetical protein
MLSLAYPVLLVAGLVAAIVRRRRLGSAARLAVSGFAVLVLTYGLGTLDVWGDGPDPAMFENELPGLGDFPPGILAVDLMLALAELVGTALLIAAVVRRGREAAPRKDRHARRRAHDNA